jgi:hypothetical protein
MTDSEDEQFAEFRVEKDGNVYIFEPLDMTRSGNRQNWWLKYSHERLNHVNFRNYHEILKDKTPFRSTLPSQMCLDGISKFNSVLKLFSQNPQQKMRLWIAFVTRVNKPVEQIKPYEIEMAVTVITHDEAPFYSCMGISRSLFNLVWIASEEQGHLTRNVSTLLLGFTAIAINKIYSNKLYQINCPTPLMIEIISKKVPIFRPNSGPVEFRGRLFNVYDQAGSLVYSDENDYESNNTFLPVRCYDEIIPPGEILWHYYSYQSVDLNICVKLVDLISAFY